MCTRTTGAIALRPSGYFFLSLMTGRKLHKSCWIELPTPADVIQRVPEMADLDDVTDGFNFSESDVDEEINPETSEDYGEENYYSVLDNGNDGAEDIDHNDATQEQHKRGNSLFFCLTPSPGRFQAEP